MAEAAPARAKALAGLGLVAASTLVGLLYKVSQASSGSFKYSTTSAIAIAEMVKLGMSACLHVTETARGDRSGRLLPSAWRSARAQVSLRALLHIWFLAALYSTNNQLSFFVYTLADPGTVFLFKAASTMIVALIQCTCVGKVFTPEQWKAMLLQGVGMIIVQYNPCQSASRYRPLAYALMALSAVVSATCAVRNEYLVKNFRISLNIQNAVLYAGGSWMNIFAFLFVPNPNSKQGHIGFFEGYSSPLAVGVIFVNALIGLAITAVYKYADAITKCIAGDVTAVILCIISSTFFELEPSVTMWCGVFVVCFAVHQYTAATPAQARVLAHPRPPEDGGGEPEKRSSGHAGQESARDHELVTLVGKEAPADRS